LDDMGQSIAASELFAAHRAARQGTLHDTFLEEGTEQIVSFRKLDRWPVAVTASIPLHSLLAPWWSRFGWSLAIVSIVLAGLSWLTLTGSKLSRKEEEAQFELNRLNEKLLVSNGDLNRALSDKISLLQEVHHRVKNNLAITSSLLRLQARRFTDPDTIAAFKDTEDRLRSVALIHEALYSSDAAGSVKLNEYLRRLVSEVALAHGAAERAISVKVEAEAIEVPLERAVPLALAVTEAISNAFKHAFDESTGGIITVSAKAHDDGFEVIVRDTGRGRTPRARSADQPVSIGSRLIQTFAGQIGASVTYHNDNGTVFRMQVPGTTSASSATA
jgi:two-component sensor histidine kinase